jgi:hypothetical protein
MKELKPGLLILFILLTSSPDSIAQDKIYIWSEIDPGWSTRALDHWDNVSGYGRVIPGQMAELITEYFTLAEKKLDLALKEQFVNPAISGSLIFSQNPGNISLSDHDLYLELRCMIMETTDVYPNYRTRKIKIEPVIKYIITVYNARGEVVSSRDFLDRIDYKTRIRHLLRGMSDHRRDIEIVSQSFTESFSGPVIAKLGSHIADIIKQNKSSEVVADPERFRSVVELSFQNRSLEFPLHYQEVKFEKNQAYAGSTANKEPVISRHTSRPAVDSDELGRMLGSGKYYALLIGVNEYADPMVNNLDQPIKDMYRLYNTLTENYIFDKESCTMLLNPSRSQIIESLDKLAREVGANDNLLVFYAGHGLWDKQLEKGFWLPSDASADNRSNWFSNSELRDYIGGIRSRHTLVISDACFSGGLFKTREAINTSSTAYLELYKLPSRKAITSGNMTMVPDKSVFIDYLIKRLEENTSNYLSSEQLYASFKIAVINNSATNQIPKFGEIRESGDEGGDFIFIRRMK